jgi:hypothetical protein
MIAAMLTLMAVTAVLAVEIGWLMSDPVCRGRSASYPAPPARIRTCTFMHTALTSGA